VDEARERCIHAFVTLGVELICRAVAAAAPWQGCQPAFESLLGAAVCRTVPHFRVLQATELSLRSVVSVLNTLKNDADINATTAALADFVSEVPTASLALLGAAMRGIMAVEPMATVVEDCLQTYLSQSDAVGSSAGFSWAPALGFYKVPELQYSAYLIAAQSRGKILALHAHFLQCLEQCDSGPTQLTVVDDVLNWLPRLNLKAASRPELTLLLHFRLALALSEQVSAGTPPDRIHARLSRLLEHVAIVAEDPDFSFLGILSRLMKADSGLPLPLRFAARSLQAFLGSFLLEGGTLRLGSSPPPTNKSHRDVLQSLEQVASGRRARYGAYKDAAAFVLDYVKNLHHTVTDMHAFVSELMLRIFGRDNAMSSAI
jgi:hypothetical protein